MFGIFISKNKRIHHRNEIIRIQGKAISTILEQTHYN